MQPIFCFEGSFPLISRSNANLVIITFQIDLWKDSRSCHHVQHDIKSRYWKPIFQCDFVNGSTIHTHPPRAIFFVRRAGTIQGLRLSWTILLQETHQPTSLKLSNVTHETKSITCWISQRRGSSFGRSLGNTSLNLFKGWFHN